jgi:ribose transport system ATP-binding protein
MDAPLLQMRGIIKQFPGVRALDGIDMVVRTGEVHCLLGQNGAGKSTLIKVLSGAHQPDEGEVLWEGRPVRLTNPQAALKLGIATIYQELDLVEGLSVADNVYLGREASTGGFVRRREQVAATRALLERLGHPEIPPGREVARLSAAARQVVSMARALAQDARVVVMDEPSAVLAHDEVANLFRIIGQLTAAGVAVVYISHRLDEIRRVGDVVTVLKDGRTVASDLPARTTPTKDVVRLMTGRSVEYVFPQRRPRRPDGEAGQDGQDGQDGQGGRDAHAVEAPELLRVEGLTLDGAFRDVSLTVRAGEIVGLAGLVGSGRSEILETIYGARHRSAGRVVVGGREVRAGGGTVGAVRAGLALAPEERKGQALLLDQSVVRNVSLATLARIARAGFIDRGREARDAEGVTRELDVRPADIARAAGTLSGGNQQKVVLARWLLNPATKVLMLDEPTRGVDVGARSELYGVVRRLADEGLGVLLVSSEVPEVLGLADRVLVVREGRVVHEAPAADLDEASVLDLVMEGSAA